MLAEVRVGEVEELDVHGGHRSRHRLLQLVGHLGLLALAGVGLAGEVHDVDAGVGARPRADAAEDVGALVDELLEDLSSRSISARSTPFDFITWTKPASFEPPPMNSVTSLDSVKVGGAS